MQTPYKTEYIITREKEEQEKICQKQNKKKTTTTKNYRYVQLSHDDN